MPDHDRVLSALGHALPDLRPGPILGQLEAYANDLWQVDSTAGPLMIKVRRFPEEDPEQLVTQRRIQSRLASQDFPTPELLWLDPSVAALDDRQLSVLRYVPGRPGDEALESLSEPDRQTVFRDFGATVGRMHAVDLPSETVWCDDAGQSHESWSGVVASSCEESCEVISGSDNPPLTDHELAAVQRRILSAVDACASDITPRIVHRDLHLGNILIDDHRFAALLDFEMVREWDFVFDFIKLDTMFAEHPETRAPFIAAYEEVAVPLPTSFPVRQWAYTGLWLLQVVADHIEGNDAYADKATDLRTWVQGNPT